MISVQGKPSTLHAIESMLKKSQITWKPKHCPLVRQVYNEPSSSIVKWRQHKLCLILCYLQMYCQIFPNLTWSKLNLGTTESVVNCTLLRFWMASLKIPRLHDWLNFSHFWGHQNEYQEPLRSQENWKWGNFATNFPSVEKVGNSVYEVF